MNKFKFLLVEDELIAKMIVEHIIKDVGHSLDVASTAKQARELLQEHTYDLIFLDFSLPDGSGIEISKELRERGVMTPIVAVTAYDASFKEQECLDGGYSGFMEKPLTREKLQATIEKFLVEPCVA